MLMYVVILLSFVSFVLLMGGVLILKIGGSTMRQIIKSKMPGQKNKGIWQIHACDDKKVKFFYKKLNGKDQVLIKSGDTKQHDEYAKISEMYHQHDVDGTPIIFTMDNLPFSFFLKKHHLDKWFYKIDALIKLTYYAVYHKKHQGATDIKISVQNLVLQMKADVKHIPGAIDCIDTILGLEDNEDLRGKPPLFVLNRQYPYLNRLKEMMLQKNNQIVNVYDLFKTTGFIKSLKNMLFEMWQNGFLAAQQSQMPTKQNKLMLYIIIIMAVIMLVVGYFTYNMNATLVNVQNKLASNSALLKQMYGGSNVAISADPTVINPTPPLAPLQ